MGDILRMLLPALMLKPEQLERLMPWPLQMPCQDLKRILVIERVRLGMMML